MIVQILGFPKRLEAKAIFPPPAPRGVGGIMGTVRVDVLVGVLVEVLVDEGVGVCVWVEVGKKVGVGASVAVTVGRDVGVTVSVPVGSGSRIVIVGVGECAPRIAVTARAGNSGSAT